MWMIKIQETSRDLVYLQIRIHSNLIFVLTGMTQHDTQLGVDWGRVASSPSLTESRTVSLLFTLILVLY